MIPYVSPITGRPLTKKNDSYAAEGGEHYSIVDHIPRFVDHEDYAQAFGFQWRTFAKLQLDSHTGKSLSRIRLERCLGQPCEALNGLNVLEVGCGAGRFTELMVGAGANVHAVDLSRAVEANRDNVGEQSNYQVAQANVYHLPYPPNSFDVVLCLGVVQHTPSPEETIRTLYRMVKPGGLLVIDHYRLRLAYFSSPALPVRALLRRLPPPTALKAVKALTHIFFPMQWKLKHTRVPYAIINRFSPLCIHFLGHPELSREYHWDWTILDSFDNLTDAYKHLLRPRDIQAMLDALPGTQGIWVNIGGNGIEARCRKHD